MTAPDQALKAAVERVTALADCMDGPLRIMPMEAVLGAYANSEIDKALHLAADLRTLLAALSSQASVMEEMASAADGVIAREDAARESLKRVGFPIKLTPEVDDLRTALSQYRTLGGE